MSQDPNRYTAPALMRSLLFVPGANPERMVKAQGLPADGLILDLEDAVATDAKDSARAAVVEVLANWPDDVKAARIIRINGTDTPYFDEDIAAAKASRAELIMLPKSETAEQVVKVAERAGKPILALIETAKGVINAASIATAHPAVVAVCFGHADFARDMQLDNNDASAGVIHHARAQVSLAARAAGIAAIDNVSLEIRDTEAFAADTVLGKQLGYQGKMCIHPSQLAAANGAYTPTAEQLAYAQEISDAWDAAQAEGRGVFSLHNKMIDRPVVDAQLAILERAKLASL